MKPLYVLLAGLLLGSCAYSTKTLEVKQFHLRDESLTSTEEPMIRMEKLRRLHGAVSAAERRNRYGQYYTLFWNDPNQAGKGDVEVVFQYQQGATASLVKRMVKKFPSTDPAGTAEFAIIGEDYFVGGKVLTWKATLLRGGQVLVTRQSYLWQ